MGIVKPDDSVTWINVTASPLSLSQYGVVVTYSDISDRKRAETLLSESEARFKALHNASFGGITIHDKGRILDCNQGLSDMTGYAIDELIGMDGLLLIAESTRPTVMANILSGYEKPYEALGLRKNGEEFPIRLEARNVPYKGKMVRTVEFRDITEQKQAEAEREKLQAQLIQSQKMESVGRLAGGVAHDFNNMLGVILGHTEMALDQLEPDQPFYDDLTAIAEAAQRSADLTRQLLIFARKQIIEPRVLDLNQTVRNMLNMLKRLIGENIILEFRPADGLWSVKVDASQVDQILANLCVNARDAIDGVGTITIETGMVTGTIDAPGGQEAIARGDYVLLSISDDGCGMDNATRERLFEPFFTTKELGKGTGLGLATIYGIVKQNKGYIHVDSAPGQGATFRIYLPRHVIADDEMTADEPQQPARGGHETLLLVEDEKAILHMVERMLTMKGYTVLTADTPARAKELAVAHGGKIDLLISDVIMPGMNGRDLAERLKDDFPDLRVLYMSGYAADVITNENELDEHAEFIQKPFGIADLAHAVRKILDQP
jgi:PAS domain S-box-containing protein